jgi:hypothetical protein
MCHHCSLQREAPRDFMSISMKMIGHYNAYHVHLKSSMG